MEKKIIAAGDASESFLESLAKVDDKVGSRKTKKNQELEENWIIKRYFMLLDQVKAIAYPIKIMKDESPDFLVVEGIAYYGIEVTQSTSEDFQVLLAESDKGHGEFFDPTSIKYDRQSVQHGKKPTRRKYTKQELQKMLHKDFSKALATPARMGSPHPSAAQWATDAVKNKIETIRSWPQKKTETTRILLYENGPDPIFDNHDFKAILKEKLLSTFNDGSVDPKAIPVDCLLGDGRHLVFDVLNSSRLISMN